MSTRQSSMKVGATTLDEVDVWCGACGEWYRDGVYRILDHSTDDDLIAQLAFNGFQAINSLTCPACGHTYVALSGIGINFSATKKSYLVIPETGLHRVVELRNEYLKQINAAANVMAEAYLFTPELLRGVDGLKEALLGLEKGSSSLGEANAALAPSDKSAVEDMPALEQALQVSEVKPLLDMSPSVSPGEAQQEGLELREEQGSIIGMTAPHEPVSDEDEFAFRAGEDADFEADGMTMEFSVDASSLGDVVQPPDGPQAIGLMPTPKDVEGELDGADLPPVEEPVIDIEAESDIAVTGDGVADVEEAVIDVEAESDIVETGEDIADLEESQRVEDVLEIDGADLADQTDVYRSLAPPALPGETGFSGYKTSEEEAVPDLGFDIHDTGDGIRISHWVPRKRGQIFRTATIELRIQLYDTYEGPFLGLLFLATGEGGRVLDYILCPLDSDSSQGNAVLDALEERCVVEVSLRSGEQEVNRRLAAPLSQNLALARRRLARGIPVTERSAVDMRDNNFSPLGDMRHNFHKDSFSQIQNAGEAALALGIMEYWQKPEQLDYLLFVQSFPAEWWEVLEYRFLSAAIEFGCALKSDLRTKALGLNFAADETELFESILSNFVEVNLRVRASELTAVQNWENWDSLLVWAEELGIDMDTDIEEMAATALGEAKAEMGQGEDGPDLVEDGIILTIDDLEATGSLLKVEEGTPADESVSSSPDYAVEGEANKSVDQSSENDADEFGSLSDVSADVDGLEVADERVDVISRMLVDGEDSDVGPVVDMLAGLALQEYQATLAGLLSAEVPLGSVLNVLQESIDLERKRVAIFCLACVEPGVNVDVCLNQLLDSSESRWKMLAEVLAEGGPGVIQTGLARLGQDDVNDERIAYLLACALARGCIAVDDLNVESNSSMGDCIRTAERLFSKLDGLPPVTFEEQLAAFIQ